MSLSTMKTVTLVFGLFYFAIGVLGFIPGITVSTTVPGQGLLLGIFAVNAIHNILHLVAGAILVYGGTAGNVVAVNRLMAVIFALLSVASLIAPVVEGVSINPPDTILHVVSTLLTGYCGFVAGPSAKRIA